MRIVATAFALAILISEPATAQLRYAELGTCELELGGTIEDCRLAYRTIGELASDRANAVLIPTWFASGSESWLRYLGPTGIVDTAGLYIIIVESLGAASSSSPSNSERSPAIGFPEITVGDMVQTSYRLTREHLDLPRLHAVVGISLGGLQAFEWAVRYPTYVETVVPIAASPQQALYQRSAWELMARTADAAARGTMTREEAAEVLGRLGILLVSSPAQVNRTQRARYEEYVQGQIRYALEIDPFEWAWQGRAIARHDVAVRYGGDLAQAASRWKGRMLIVISTLDHSISPEPAEEFATLTGAELLRLDDPAAHVAIFSNPKAQAAVREFVRK